MSTAVIDHTLTSDIYTEQQIDSWLSKYSEDEQRKINNNPMMWRLTTHYTQLVINNLLAARRPQVNVSKPKSKPVPDTDSDSDAIPIDMFPDSGSDSDAMGGIFGDLSSSDDEEICKQNGDKKTITDNKLLDKYATS